jgi:hypothetical protein
MAGVQLIMAVRVEARRIATRAKLQHTAPLQMPLRRCTLEGESTQGNSGQGRAGRGRKVLRLISGILACLSIVILLDHHRIVFRPVAFAGPSSCGCHALPNMQRPPTRSLYEEGWAWAT